MSVLYVIGFISVFIQPVRRGFTVSYIDTRTKEIVDSHPVYGRLNPKQIKAMAELIHDRRAA